MEIAIAILSAALGLFLRLYLYRKTQEMKWAVVGTSLISFGIVLGAWLFLTRYVFQHRNG
jgi:prepilin signal peptidase PulO-like enzyme (type II secretory pathway)